MHTRTEREKAKQKSVKLCTCHRGYITFAPQFIPVQSLDRLDRRGGHEGRFSRDPLPVFSAGGPCEQFWHRQGSPLFDIVHPAFPLPMTASPNLQGTLEDGFREAVVVCDTSEPCKFPSLDSCLKRSLWTHKAVELAPHPVVGLSKLWVNVRSIKCHGNLLKTKTKKEERIKRRCVHQASFMPLIFWFSMQAF